MRRNKPSQVGLVPMQSTSAPVISQQANQFTSIEHVFRYQIFICKLFGGFLFDWPSRMLAIAYRLIITIAVMSVKSKVYKFRFLGDKNLDRSFLNNMQFYVTIYTFALVLSLFEVFIMDIRYHDTLTIILKKRLHKLYLTMPEQNLVAADQRPRRSSKAERVRQNGIRTLNRIMACNVVAFAILILIGSKIYYFQEIEQEFRSKSNTWSVVIPVGKIIFELLIHVILTLASIHLYGLSMISHLIVACLTDILACVRRPGGQRALDISQRPQVQATQVMIQVRDVLIVLSRVLNLDFGFIYAHDFSLAMAMMGIALTNASSHEPILAWFFGAQVLFMIARMFSFRFSYHLLREEVEQIKDECHKQLTISRGHSSRVEAKTNCQLAEELQVILKSIPTDWFKCDIKSLMKQILSLFAFTVSLQRIATTRLGNRPRSYVVRVRYQ